MSTPSDTDGYALGETIRLRARFDEDVTAAAGSTLALTMTDSPRVMDLGSATGTDVVFSYTVLPSDLDTDGISVPADPFGVGTVIEDLVGNAADLDHAGLSDQAGHEVDGVAPRVRGGGIAFDREDAVYSAGDTVTVRVRMTEHVVISGSPAITLSFGTATTSMDYVRLEAFSTSTPDLMDTLVFEHTIQGGQTVDGALVVVEDSLTPPSGIRDRVGNDGDLRHPEVRGGEVDLTAPTITGLAVASTPTRNSRYGIGQDIEITVTFSEDVRINGASTLELTVGTATVDIAQVAVGPGGVVLYRYNVAEGLSDTDGISVAANALSLSAADAITDEHGNNREPRPRRAGRQRGPPGGRGQTRDNRHLVEHPARGDRGIPAGRGHRGRAPVVGDRGTDRRRPADTRGAGPREPHDGQTGHRPLPVRGERSGRSGGRRP